MELFALAKDLLLCSHSFFFKLLRAMVIFGAGWLIAKLIKEAIINASALKFFLNLFSSPYERQEKLLSNSAVKHVFLEIIGIIIYWIIILGALILSLKSLL
jgi:hypothetical protein